jgi:hypothetical protein
MDENRISTVLKNLPATTVHLKTAGGTLRKINT